MKLAVYHQLPSGGGKRALFEIFQRLSKDHDITLYTYQDCESYLSLTKLAKKVVWLKPSESSRSRLNKLRIGREIKHYEAQQAELAATIDDGEFDLVFVHPSRYMQSPSVLHYLHTPTLYYSQEIRRTWYEKRLRDRLIRGGLKGSLIGYREQKLARLDARNMLAASRVLVNSFHSAEAHKRAYGRQVEVAYLGIDAGKPVAKLARSKSNTSGPWQLLMVGGLEPFKNQASLVQAAAFLAEQGQATELHFVFDRADASYRAEVEALARNLQVSVHLHENITDAALRKLYATADITVCLADLEPFGLTPLESMATDTRVVALQEGGYRETVIEGLNGAFTPTLQPVHIATAIQRAHKLKLHPGALHRHVLDRWSWDDCVSRLAIHLQDLAQRG